MATLDFKWRRSRVPAILQTESAECGLACLAMVASAHGLDTDLATLRHRFSMSLKGVTLVELVRMADALQLASRPLRAELGQMEHLRTPCVLHWDMNHFVVLVSVRRGVALIHDPACGERRLTMAELSPHFTGVALELQPMPGFAPRQERQAVRWRELMGPVGGLGRALTQIFVLALALEAFVLLSPYFMQWVVDDVLVSANRDLLITLGIGFGLLVLIQTATSAARSWAVLALSASLNLQWLLNVFTHLLRLPIAWFEKRHPGDILSRFGAVQQIQQALTTSFIEALLDGAMVALTLVVMAVYSMPLTALAVGTVLAYALLRLVLLRRLRQASAEALIHESRQTSHFLESLHGITAIKLFGAQAARHARFSTLVVETMNADFATRKLDLVVTVGNRLLFGLERVAVIWLGALFVLEQRMSVGMLFAFFAYREQFVLRFSGLIDKAVALRVLRLQGDRLADIVLTAPEVETALGAPAVVQQPSIELVDVSFRYADGEPDVLSHVTLHIEAGESVAIVGPSGCGKTTLLKVMLGILRPSSGEVRIGGVALSRMGLARARALVGAVMQDEPLFSGSVADNIAFFDPEPERARIEQCARIAAAHEDIVAMPMGYHTLIGALGSALSGGQKQRLLLARALYKRPQILMLDEATSSLDVESERQVNQSIRQLQLTRVIIAHRPETIASATRVIALEDGRVRQDVPAAHPPTDVLALNAHV